MPSLLELLNRAQKDNIVSYGDTAYIPAATTDSLNSDVGKFEARPNSLEKVLKKSLKNPLDIQNVFDKAGRLIIDTRGVINPFRTKIFTEKFQSNTTGGEILNQFVSLAGSILKQRTRIPDTIFKAKTLPPPISMTALQPQNASRGEVDIEANTPYYVKTVFKPGAEILGGAARSAIQGDLRAAKQAALQAGLNLARKLGRKNKLTLDDTYIQSSYHPAAMDLNLDGRIGGKKGIDNGEDGAKTYTGFKEYYLTKIGGTRPVAFNGVPTTNGTMKTLVSRDAAEFEMHTNRMIDYLIESRFPVGVIPEQSLIPWVKMHPIGFEPIYLPGTISGLSEDIQSTWETYKYIGSPFSSYKYNGVERNIQFNIHLYWQSGTQIYRIKKQIEYIKQLCFPAPDISIAKYKNSPTGSLGASDQLFYRPQFLELTIHGYNRKMFGFIESLNINIPDDTSWPSTNINSEFSKSSKKPPKMDQKLWDALLTNTIFPSNVEISINFKIIENPHAELSGTGTKVTYSYNLDGNGYNSTNNNKYPTRDSVMFVKEEDITKRDETPVAAATTQPAATPNKVTPAKKNASSKKSTSKPTKTETKTTTVAPVWQEVINDQAKDKSYPFLTGKKQNNDIFRVPSYDEMLQNIEKSKKQEEAKKKLDALNSGISGN